MNELCPKCKPKPNVNKSYFQIIFLEDW